MGYLKCSRCKKDYFVDEDNPNYHYSSQTDIKMCSWCNEYYNSLKKGDWYQNEKGEFLQKD